MENWPGLPAARGWQEELALIGRWAGDELRPVEGTEALAGIDISQGAFWVSGWRFDGDDEGSSHDLFRMKLAGCATTATASQPRIMRYGTEVR